MMFGDHRQTRVGIDDSKITINGAPAYEGLQADGVPLDGLLLNSRMVQALFDDDNPETVDRWAYPDTCEWDPERNVREFIDAMADWRRHGLRGITINLQGGSPEGYSNQPGNQPWHVSAYDADGGLKDAWMDRLERVLDTADELGMVVLLGYFYFGQDQRLDDEAGVRNAIQNVTEWLLEREYTNILVEICNECDIYYDHDLLDSSSVHEAIELVSTIGTDGFRYPVGTSFSGGVIPTDDVVSVSDFVLLHGNTVDDHNRIAAMVEAVRDLDSYRPMPIIFNEDDHFEFDDPPNHMTTALEHGASWGFFDPGENNYRDGYQCPPVNWQLNTERKQAFFSSIAMLTNSNVQ